MSRQTPTEHHIRDRLARGYGSGEGDDFKEWLEFRDFSSQGNTSRFTSIVTGRRHTVFSGIEDDLFCTVERQPQTHNIQLQRAMEREITTACAKALGIIPQKYRDTDVLTVMSLDAVAERFTPEGNPKYAAFDSKPSTALADKRTLELLSIHRLYCAYRGWTHHIVTEQTFPVDVRKNLAWVRGGRRKELEIETPIGLFSTLPALMLSDLGTLTRPLSLHDYAARFERRHDLPVGIGLRILKILAWNHQIHVEINGPLIQRTSTKGLLKQAPRGQTGK